MNLRELMRAAMRGEPAPPIPTMPQICDDTGVRVYEDDWIWGMMRCQSEKPMADQVTMTADG